MAKEKLHINSNFEIEEVGLKFKCTHPIYTRNGQSSWCYVTSE